MRQTLLTSGHIARLLNRPVDRVRHVLNTRDIAPIGRAGITNVYGASAVGLVEAELDRIEARKKRRDEREVAK